MKHLKLFEDLNRVDFQFNLKKFCEEYLAYLMDDGYKISVRSTQILYNKKFRIFLHTNNKFVFNWSDIKNDFIPFYEILKKNYKLFNHYQSASAYTKADIEPCYVILRSDKEIDLYDRLIYSDDFEKNNILSLEIEVYIT